MENTIGTFWWDHMPTASRILREAQDTLCSGRSVVLRSPGTIPWESLLVERLTAPLGERLGVQKLKELDVSDDTLSPGARLLETFAEEDQKDGYWPSEPEERYMAQHPEISLSRAIVIVRGIRGKACEAWLKTVTSYLAAAGERHGVFALLMQDTQSRDLRKDMGRYLDLGRDLSEQDTLMVCQAVLTEQNIRGAMANYITELAAALAAYAPEPAAALASEGTALAHDPLGTAAAILRKDTARQREAVWRAQIRTVYPILEEQRQRYLQKYGHRFPKDLSIPNGYGGYITEPKELEIVHIWFLCQSRGLADKADIDQLARMRKARNDLSHLDPIPWKSLEALGLFR